MCGITGFWASKRNADLQNTHSVLDAMSGVIAHRGPDDHGVWIDDESGLALAHRRLAVLELSPNGAQPMISESGRLVLVFNGEIYNHRALRKEIAASGRAIDWRGYSDTETLLAAIEIWGLEKALARCVGMFALALWDQRQRRLFLARDRMGEKPLFYGWCGPGKAFVFGSELKSLRAFPGFRGEIDRTALELYFQFSAVPSPYSIYTDVFKVRPGCVVEIDRGALESNCASETPYWELRSVVEQAGCYPFTSETEALSALEQGLDEAIALQTVADVPLGAFLSGGIDSSLIVAMMQARSSRRVKTFTVGFHEADHDESGYAAAVARHLDTDHQELQVSAHEARLLIPSLPIIYDEPFADSSQIPTMLVCRAARERVTVALSGDGGDELFGGYDRYQTWSRFSNAGSWIPRLVRVAGEKAVATPAELLRSASRIHPRLYSVGLIAERLQRLTRRLAQLEDYNELYHSAVSEWPQSPTIVRASDDQRRTRKQIITPEALGTLEERMMFWDTLTYLPDDILTKVDRASMRVSLETRAPFLDHRVVELAWRIPIEIKIKDGLGKWPLRQLLYRRVPKHLVERPKSGFSVPIGAWLRGPLRDWAESLISPDRLKKEGYLEANVVADTWRQHLHGGRDHGGRLWSVLMFQAWLETQ